MALKRRSSGTVTFEVSDSQYLCGFCHNSGVAETTKGRLVPCRCGQPAVEGADGPPSQSRPRVL